MQNFPSFEDWFKDRIDKDKIKIDLDDDDDNDDDSSDPSKSIMSGMVRSPKKWKISDQPSLRQRIQDRLNKIREKINKKDKTSDLVPYEDVPEDVPLPWLPPNQDLPTFLTMPFLPSKTREEPQTGLDALVNLPQQEEKPRLLTQDKTTIGMKK